MLQHVPTEGDASKHAFEFFYRVNEAQLYLLVLHSNESKGEMRFLSYKIKMSEYDWKQRFSSLRGISLTRNRGLQTLGRFQQHNDASTLLLSSPLALSSFYTDSKWLA
jgi:hypothetical protein